MAHAIADVEEVVRAGVPVDAVAPRRACSVVAQADGFEEGATFRAARGVGATRVTEWGGATRPASMRLRGHGQTAAMTLDPGPAAHPRAADRHPGPRRGPRRRPVAPHHRPRPADAMPSELTMTGARRTPPGLAEAPRVAKVRDPLGGCPTWRP